jgi:hypothetical protein
MIIELSGHAVSTTAASNQNAKQKTRLSVAAASFRLNTNKKIEKDSEPRFTQ